MQPLGSTEIPYQLLGHMEQGTSSQGLPDIESSPDEQDTTQALTTLYINVMYYSALSNLYLQSILPDNLAEINAEKPRLKIALQRSYTDFTLAAKWLSANGGEYIESSPAKHYYDEVLGMGSGPVKNIATFYSHDMS